MEFSDVKIFGLIIYSYILLVHIEITILLGPFSGPHMKNTSQFNQ